MLLPFAEHAQADTSKFLDYCLNIEHPSGKHKARVFRSALGITSLDWEVLRDAVVSAVLQHPATRDGRNSYGEIYVVDFVMEHQHKTAVVRTSWIIDDGKNFPRLTSCFVLKS